MPYTGSDVAEEARQVHLNEPSGGTLFTDSIMFPVVRKCYEDAQRRCAREGVKVTSEYSSAPIAVAANATTIASPTDLLVPKEILHRPSGSTGIFMPMDEKNWEPEELPQSTLTKWAWREETIYILPSTNNEEAKIRYLKTLPAIANLAANILITDLKGYLAAKVAAVCWANLLENLGHAGIVNDHAESLWDDFLSNHTKQRQNTPVRRRPMRRPRMRIT